VGSEAAVEDTCAAATGLAAGLAWVGLELGLELDLEESGLAVGVAELDGGDLAGKRAEGVAGVEDGVFAVVLAAMAREEAGTVSVTV